jgi:hypothetical protein
LNLNQFTVERRKLEHSADEPVARDTGVGKRRRGTRFEALAESAGPPRRCNADNSKLSRNCLESKTLNSGIAIYSYGRNQFQMINTVSRMVFALLVSPMVIGCVSSAGEDTFSDNTDQMASPLLTPDSVNPNANSQCSSGNLCLWQDANYSGGFIKFASGHLGANYAGLKFDNGVAVSFNVSSLWNRGSHTVNFRALPDINGDSFCLQQSSGGFRQNLTLDSCSAGGNANDKFRSALEIIPVP